MSRTESGSNAQRNNVDLSREGKTKPGIVGDSSVAQVKGKVEAAQASLSKVVKVIEMPEMRVEAVRPTGNKNIDKQNYLLDRNGISQGDFLEIAYGKDYALAGLGADNTIPIKDLQKYIGMRTGQQDGFLGPQTLTALYKFSQEYPKAPIFEDFPGRYEAIQRAAAHYGIAKNKGRDAGV